MKDYFKQLSECVPVGKNNAVSMRNLADTLNVSPRALRSIIQRARAAGLPICSEWDEQSGYYMPADISEAVSYYRQQRARIKSATEALNGVREFIGGAAYE